MTFEIAGLRVLNWINTVGVAGASDVLSGCFVDDGQDENVLEIVEISQDRSLRCQQAGKERRFPLKRLATSVILDERPGFPLKNALAAIMSPFDEKKDQAEQYLKSRGIPIHKIASSTDLFALAAALKLHDSGQLPSPTDQDRFYEVFKRADLLHIGSKMVTQWLTRAGHGGSNVDAGILIKLAYLYRHTGELEKALECTDSVFSSTTTVQETNLQKAILATERAAILMDLFEVTRRAELLTDARKAAGTAYAITPGSSEVSAIYGRLKMLESQIR